MTRTLREASFARPPRCPLAPVLAAAALAALLGACSSGSGSWGGEPLAGRTTAASARVCADANGNGACGPEEPSDRTGADGSFSLPAGAGDSTLLVEVEGGVSTDAGTGERFPQSFTLAAAAGHRYLITPFSSIALDLPERLGARPEEALRAVFAIPSSVPVLPAAPVGGSPRVGGFSRVAATVYARAQAQAKAAGATPVEARRAAARQTLDAAPGLADYFTATLGGKAPPPLKSSDAETIDALMAEARQGIVLQDLEGGPGSFGAAYNEVTGALLTGQQCVDAVGETLQRTCRNQWAFEVEILSGVDEVLERLNSAFGAKADVIVASASGNLSMEEYKESRKESVHVFVDASMKRCNYGLTGVLRSAYEPEYASAYDGFVSECGNRFLSDITTGGRFIGTFDKVFTSSEDREAFKLKLKAKVAGITVYDHTWRDRTNKAFAELDMSVQIMSTSGDVSLLNGTLETLTQRFSDFYDRMYGSDCTGDRAFASCAYTGSFADYSTATGVAKDPARAFDRLQGNYYRWVAAQSAYEAALARADDVVAHPERYNLEGSTDPFYDVQLEEGDGAGTEPSAPPSLESIRALALTAGQQIALLRAEADTCRDDLSHCTTTPGQGGFLSWTELVQLLPTRKVFVHADCEDLSYQYGAVADDDYTAYYGGDFLKPYPARCRSMDTAEPETYLVLPDASPDADNLTANYSIRVDAEGRRTQRLLREFRLHPVVADGGYRLQAFVPTQAPEVETTFAQDSQEPPLLAATCDGSTVRANLDLTGTPFRFAAAVTGFVVDQAGHPAPSALSADGRVLEVTVKGTGGSCVSAAFVPPTDGIDVEYAP